MDELIFERKAEDNKYLHKDFHASINNAIDYIGRHFGTDAVKEYIKQYVFSRYEKMTLSELKAYFEEIYEAEEVRDRLSVSLENGVLSVSVTSSPGIDYFNSFGEVKSEWYYLTDTYLYECLAELCGLFYEPVFYDEKTGAVKFLLKEIGA